MAIYLAVFVLQKFGENFDMDEDIGDEDDEDLLKNNEISHGNH